MFSNYNTLQQRLRAAYRESAMLRSSAPPALTVPLVQYWYISHAFRKELSQMEKELGVQINAEVSVSVTAVDQTRRDSVKRATERFTDLVQNSMKGIQCVKIPHAQVESGIVKQVMHNIQIDRAKMMIHMCADQFLLFGPEPIISGVEEQMDLEPGVKLERSLVSSMSSKAETGRDLREAAGRTAVEVNDDCLICMDEFTDRRKLKCGHEFCRECLDQSVKAQGEICPVCKDVFGTLIGTQPKGTMEIFNQRSSLPGYPRCGTIEIVYRIPDGVQTERHPNPGKRFYGTTRKAYLPDNDEGEHVLKLLKRAFVQRLIFTVGISTTTGASDSVIWSDIDHKTNTTGGPQSYGYPDPDYLNRMREQLKAKGIE